MSLGKMFEFIYYENVSDNYNDEREREEICYAWGFIYLLYVFHNN